MLGDRYYERALIIILKITLELLLGHSRCAYVQNLVLGHLIISNN
jgi:hypothetical protein